MRRVQKKQADSLVESLGKVHEQIRTAVEKKDRMAVMSLLGDGQNTAIALGNLVEQAEGEGLPIIEVLEEYCEKAYQMYEDFNANRLLDADEVSKLLLQFLDRIQDHLENDIKVRLEAVFFPYKASMWDSLESIWEAAEADPDCDSYVVPIPYYDKNPDGSFGTMRYEGDLYPDYVPVTGYEEYDFETRKPDMIFIHNPYDEHNHMTSVPVRFYAKNLKKYTDQLVYVPYFILGEPDPDDENALKNLDDFCVVSGVLHAHKVIVQSEAMREAYVKIMMRYFGKDTQTHWENKILGIGSPKIDKLLNTKKEDVKIPDEWRKKIQKPSGQQKKVMLYNTSVLALVQHEEHMLDKMKRVFLTFKEHQEEMTLLWRPHPLIHAAVESMRPELRAGYQKLVEWYKEEDWGIYDDSADLDRALALSDGYYGDPSSLVQLCSKIGMPVMIQNVEV